ncbi:MAG TPA: phosphoglycolate phosphatase [Eubacterium sp.]|nr:phosphoglycolate phosphatase [Eubacterium sp.]
MIKYCLFDLDGTLVKSETGIIRSAMYALDNMGIKEYDMDKLKHFIGPSLYDTFAHVYGMSEEDVNRAIELYREVYEDKNIYEVSLYDGVVELLEMIRRSGRRIFLVTSKPYNMAYRVLSYLGIDIYFEDIYSPELTDHTSDKSQLIARFLEEMQIGDLSSVAMIGDKIYDISAANACGIKSIGVSYGYGDRTELAGATCVVDSPEEVYRRL